MEFQLHVSVVLFVIKITSNSFVSAAAFLGAQLAPCHLGMEKIHTHSLEGHWKFLGGGGLESKNFRNKV